MVQEAKIIQQWGPFYFTRKALDIRTQANLWYFEASLIIVKIMITVLAIIFDILTGVLYVVFLVIKYLIIIIFSAIKEGTIFLLKKIISLLVYLIGLVLTIAILYWIVSHWHLFVEIVNKLSAYIK